MTIKRSWAKHLHHFVFTVHYRTADRRNARYILKGCRTMEEAESMLASLSAEKLELASALRLNTEKLLPRLLDPRLSLTNMGLVDEFCAWLQNVRHATPASVRLYRHGVEQFARWVAQKRGTFTAANWNSQDVDEWVHSHATWKESTLRANHKFVGAFGKWVVAQGWRHDNPTFGSTVNVRALSEEQRAVKRAPIFTPAQFDLVLQRMPATGWYRWVALLGWHCGCRISDTLTLRRDDLKKEGWIKYRSPKSQKVIEHELPLELWRELCAYPVDLQFPDYVFGEVAVQSKSVLCAPSSHFNAELKKLGFPKHTSHSFRRSYATRVTGESGIEVAQAGMGHSSVEQTEAYVESAHPMRPRKARKSLFNLPPDYRVEIGSWRTRNDPDQPLTAAEKQEEEWEASMRGEPSAAASAPPSPATAPACTTASCAPELSPCPSDPVD